MLCTKRAVFCLILCFSLTLAAEESTDTKTTFVSDKSVYVLPEIIVTADKKPASAQSLPESITPITGETLNDDDIKFLKDAAEFAPDILMTDFGARRLSNPYFRGIGAGPSNPGVTSYYDGIPQLNANSSSIELLDEDQVEFVRGPQGALYGVNTIGGIINITSKMPSTTFTFNEDGEFGNFNYKSEKLDFSGPISGDNLLFSISGGYDYRDGYTINTLNNSGVDSRQTYFGKAQLYYKANDNFDGRFIFNSEQDNDGDYPLSELYGLRADPWTCQHDFDGFTKRDVVSNTLIMNLKLDDILVTSTTGYLWWNTNEATDLDYTALPLLTSSDLENQYQFTEEVRFSSRKAIPLDKDLALNWQSGIFLSSTEFTDGSATNYEAMYAGMLQPPLPAFTNYSGASQDNLGMSIYAQGDVEIGGSLDVKAGARFDYQQDSASLTANPAFTAPTDQNLSSSFSQVSPTVGVTYNLTLDSMIYGTIATGFKAGGFNPGAPISNDAYGQEYSLTYEIGSKNQFFDKTLEVNLAVFLINWQDLQLEVPDLFVPAQYYVANTGSATSKGFELESKYKVLAGFDIFGSLGYTNATFGSGSTDLGQDVSGNTLPFTPEFTADLGSQYSIKVEENTSVYVRLEANMCGDYKYDAFNMTGQDNYILTNARAGVKGKWWALEGWIKNMFNVNYIPVAFPYGQLAAPSGYLGASGDPKTFGGRLKIFF